jgi:trimethylamine---corrinoid protein Co-methyltransferase
MHTAGHAFSVLSATEIERIHQSALRILGEMGMEIQNETLLGRLAEAGFPIDLSKARVYFPEKLVETYLSQAQKHDWERHVPSVGGSAGIYHGRYHDPRTNELVPWDELNLAFYFALARSLEHIHGAHMLGSRLPVPGPLEPLYERYYCWKYGGQEGSSIYLDELCPYLLELYLLKTARTGKPLIDAFRGTVYLIPALKLGRHEAYQVVYFMEHGLRVRIGGSMLTMGADAPVTLAGAVTLNLAEQLALRLLNWALWGDTSFHLGGSLAGLDMRTTIRPFGRPEMAIANLMMAQIARFYGASFSGHSGLSDAKLPSVEAGAQKAISAVATLLAGGSFWMDAGLLGIDEICSPVQLVLDNEFLSALKRFTHPFEVDEQAIALDLILEAGPGGQYLDKVHTARRFRSEHWNPAIWSRQMLQSWLAGERKIDVELALEVIEKVKQEDYLESQLDEPFEKEILNLIARAEKDLL